MTSRLSRTFTLIALVGVGANLAAEENKIPQYEEGWWQQVAASIAESEYQINSGAAEFGQATFYAVNRTQNLRASFSATGVTVTPRVEQDASWSLGLSLLGSEQYGALVPAAVLERKAEEQTVTYLRGDISETYANEKSGILLNVDLSGSATLNENTALAFQLDTNLDAVVGNNATLIEFYAHGVRVARISLKASPDALGGVPMVRLSGNELLILASKSAKGSTSVQMALTTIAGEDTQVGPSTTPDSILSEEQPDSNFALSVAAAGDVNGDGFSDVIVGAPDYDVGQLTSAGRVLVFAGSSVGLATSPFWSSDGEILNGRLGSSVASAGDFNADGISDVVVGADASNTIVGADALNIAIVYVGSTSGDLAEVARFDGPIGNDGVTGNFGFSVDSAGDVNGDGADDIVVGAPEYENSGRAYVYFSPFGASSTAGSSHCLAVPDLRSGCVFNPSTDPPCEKSQFGYSVSGAGDVDGDGRGDLIVGAPFYDTSPSVCSTPEQRSGEAFVYLGSNLDVSHSPDACSSVENWCTNETNSGGGRVGFSVDTAGDVDGDGFDDVIVGAPSLTHTVNPRTNFCGQTIDDAGAALVFRATPGGNGILESGGFTNSNWRAIGHDGTRSPQLSTGFGAFVASAGDVNGDGAGDILVGAPGDSGLALDGGAAFLYLGSVDAGMSRTFDQNVYRFLVGCSSADSGRLAFLIDADWSVFGTQRSGNLGLVAASAGDVDADGFSDILAAERGSASVFQGGGFLPHGDLSGSGVPVIQNVAAFVGDINGDSRDDEVWRNNNNILARAGRSDGRFGDGPNWVLRDNISPNESIAGAGDVNGDGYADIIVGRPANNRVLIFAGGKPPNMDGPWVIDAAASPFGTAVNSAGDVNGDGFSDIIVGDPSFNSDTGRVLVFFGGRSRLPSSGTLNVDADTADWSSVGAVPGGRFGYSVASAGDINADGYSDVVVGAPGSGIDDTGDPGEAFLFLGSPLTPLEAQSWSTIGSGQPGAEFGASVASAGDVNGDGFGDVVVGAPGTNLFDEIDVGQVFAYLGSAAGLSVIEAWSAEGLKGGDRLGQAVGNAGDINGDGLSDLVAGALVFLGAKHGVSSVPAWSSENVTLPSLVTLAGLSMSGGGDYNGDGFSDFYIDGHGPFLGNTFFGVNKQRHESTGVSRLPQQLQASDGEIVAPLGVLDESSGTSFQIRVRRPDAPGRYGLEWEIKPLGTPFDGSGLQRGVLTNNGPGASLDLTETVEQLDPGTPYRWRARILSDSATAPRSPWLSISGGTQGAHLLTAGPRAPFLFASVGPVQNMRVFADSLRPVFQWHAGANTSFEIEWAGNVEFLDPRVSSGSLGATGNDIETYTPDATSWLEILETAQNPDFREAPVFWRITANGGVASETRALRLAAAEGPVVSSPADGQTSFAAPSVSWDANHNERFQIRFSATDFLGEPLIVVSDDDDTPDTADDFNIIGTEITVSDAIWSEVEALVPPGADGTGIVYFAVRAVDALGRPSISEVRSLKVNATGTAARPPSGTGGGKGGGAVGLLFLTILALLGFVRYSVRHEIRSMRLSK